jgi:hypothetical protein
MKTEWKIVMILSLIVFVLLILRKPIKKLMTRGYINKNPGNIRLTYKNGVKTYWKGEIDGTDKDFKTFKTMADGYRALAALLKEYSTYGWNTITSIISRYAPSSENNTEAYIKSVSSQTDIDPNEVIDYSNISDFKNLIAAISYHENGIKPDLNDIEAGFKKL